MEKKIDEILDVYSKEVNYILSLMGKLSDDERMDVISSFCKYCGSSDNHCQCWNDE